MKRSCFVLLFLIFNFSFLIFHSPREARAALAPLFEPGGQACSRTADYQDRSSPGCYVNKGGTSTYNLYIPDPQSSPPRGQDPNVSQTCFVVTRGKTVTHGPDYTPDYEVVVQTNPPLTFISTLETQWPWDIPEETDYKKFTLENPIAQFFADTFALQGHQPHPHPSRRQDHRRPVRSPGKTSTPPVSSQRPGGLLPIIRVPENL